MAYTNVPSVTRDEITEVTVYLDDFDTDDILEYIKKEYNELFDALDELTVTVDLGKDQSEIADISKKLVEIYKQLL